MFIQNASSFLVRLRFGLHLGVLAGLHEFTKDVSIQFFVVNHGFKFIGTAQDWLVDEVVEIGR
jgi:hypothetical protein